MTSEQPRVRCGRPSKGTRIPLSVRLDPSVRLLVTDEAEYRGLDAGPYVADLLAYAFGRPDLMRELHPTAVPARAKDLRGDLIRRIAAEVATTPPTTPVRPAEAKRRLTVRFDPDVKSLLDSYAGKEGLGVGPFAADVVAFLFGRADLVLTVGTGQEVMDFKQSA